MVKPITVRDAPWCRRCTGVIAMTDTITACDAATAKIAYRATIG